MIIPSRFKVGGLTYKVGFGQVPCDNLGMTSHVEGQIIITPGLSKPFAEQTYIHELFHVAWAQSGMDQTMKAVCSHPESEEIICNALANAFYSLLKGGALGRL